MLAEPRVILAAAQGLAAERRRGELIVSSVLARRQPSAID
jgi:hypothetical protein